MSHAASIFVLSALLTGCSVNGTHPQATPPAPKPAAVALPPPEQPLSIPQTAVHLPSPQPINPDAIPAKPAEEPQQSEKTEATVPAKPIRRPAGPQPKPAESEPPATVPAPAQTETASPFQPILSADEQKRLQDATDARRREIAGRLSHMGRRLSNHDRNLVERIKSFVKLSEDAAKRGDYTQADALSERALILAKELQVE